MPQTAIISPQIIDSTSIGRDLITAADQAAAQAIIGVTGVDTGADYTWTGDHTFDGSVTLANAEWSSSNGVFNQPDINGFHYFAFNGSNVFRASALDFIPMSNGTKALGRSDLRFSDVLSVDGSFSGSLVSEAGGSYKLYNLGTEGDTDTEALVVSADGTTYDIFSTITGTGAHRRIDIGGSVGTAFRGIRLDTTNGILEWVYNNATKFRVDANACKISTQGTVINDLRPNVSGASYNGTSTFRWSNVASVDGDFSGDVVMAANVNFTNLPTSDPAVAGQLWNDSGTVKISAG